MMKTTRFAALMMLTFVFGACKAWSPNATPESIEVDDTALADFYFLEDFDVTDVSVIVVWDDASQEVVSIEPSMLADNDLNKLKEPGTHLLQVEYRGVSTTFEIVLRRRVVQFFDDPADNTLTNQYRYSLVGNREDINPLFFSMYFPLGLGLPQLTEDEIHALVGQPVEVLKETITTVFDLYAYLLAVNFNQDMHPFQMSNWYYSDEHDMDFFIFESAELGLALNTAGCAGLANIAHYILEDNYDDIGFLWYYAHDQGGHSFNYIEHNGLFYIIDFTQFRGIWQDIGWFNLTRFPVIYEDLESWVDFNVSFRKTYQSSVTDFYARFEERNAYIPGNMRVWDLENSHFYIYDENTEEALNGYVRFNSQRALLEALGLSEEDLWFPDIIDLDE